MADNHELVDFKNLVSEAIEGEKDSLRRLSEEIWSNPELHYEEVTAHKVLTDYLETRSFRVDRKYCDIKTAFRARYVSGFLLGFAKVATHILLFLEGSIQIKLILVLVLDLIRALIEFITFKVGRATQGQYMVPLKHNDLLLV